MRHYDVVVIGAGGVGTATAYHLARDGRRVLLLEQFTVGHKQGSSHGGSRITRHTHVEEEYATLIPPSLELWRQLERESGVSLLTLVGLLDIAPPDHGEMTGRIAVMEKWNYPYRLLSRADVAAEFPQFRIPPGWVGLHHADAGILSADAVVRTLAARAAAHGAEIWEETQVLSLAARGGDVAVSLEGRAGRREIEAGQAVLAAGPWSGRFFRDLGLTALLDLPLRVTHQQVVYLPVVAERQDLYAPEGCPIFIFLPRYHFYGFPIWERPGQIKVATELTDSQIDLGRYDRRVDEQAVRTLCAEVSRYLVGIVPEPAHVETCLYTLSPDGHFIVDRHPAHPQILCAAGFSGRGFKHIMVVGRLLADLARSGPGDYSSSFWRNLFRIDRFQTQVQDG